jgi:hypothetical protein
MYRHAKKRFEGYVQIQVYIPLSATTSLDTDTMSFPALPSRILTLSTVPFPITSRLLSRSVVSTSIPPITNKFESANYLTHCEETQEFGSDNSSGGQLCSADTSNLLENAGRVCRAGCLGEER